MLLETRISLVPRLLKDRKNGKLDVSNRYLNSTRQQMQYAREIATYLINQIVPLRSTAEEVAQLHRIMLCTSLHSFPRPNAKTLAEIMKWTKKRRRVKRKSRQLKRLRNNRGRNKTTVKQCNRELTRLRKKIAKWNSKPNVRLSNAMRNTRPSLHNTAYCVRGEDGELVFD
jgi:hypothetical protein